jgi:hypothetical protein
MSTRLASNYHSTQEYESTLGVYEVMNCMIHTIEEEKTKFKIYSPKRGKMIDELRINQLTILKDINNYSYPKHNYMKRNIQLIANIPLFIDILIFKTTKC